MKPWLLSKKETALNLLDGQPKAAADLNPEYYQEALNVYSKVRSVGVNMDHVNPKDFKTSKEFLEFIRIELRKEFLGEDKTKAKKAGRALAQMAAFDW